MSGVLMSQRQFAKYIGRSVGYVNKKVKEGVIPLHGPKRKIKAEEAKAALEAAKDPTRDAQRHANEAKRKGEDRMNERSIFSEEVLPEQSLADMTDEERDEYNRKLRAEREELERLRDQVKSTGGKVEEVDLSELTQNEVKIFKEYYLGKIAELEYQKKLEDVVAKQEVRKDGYELGRATKLSVMAIAPRAAVDIASVFVISDVKKIESIIEKYALGALEDISDKLAAN